MTACRCYRTALKVCHEPNHVTVFVIMSQFKMGISCTTQQLKVTTGFVLIMTLRVTRQAWPNGTQQAKTSVHKNRARKRSSGWNVSTVSCGDDVTRFTLNCCRQEAGNRTAQFPIVFITSWRTRLGNQSLFLKAFFRLFTCSCPFFGGVGAERTTSCCSRVIRNCNLHHANVFFLCYHSRSGPRRLEKVAFIIRKLGVRCNAGSILQLGNNNTERKPDLNQCFLSMKYDGREQTLPELF